MILSPEEELRYNRQIILKQIDFEGQEAIKMSRVLVLGLGGLGCAASQYLAAAGVGHMTLIDDDQVERSNLQRQILHQDKDVGLWKVDSARESLSKLNPFMKIKTINQRLSDDSLSEQIQSHDIVLDCSDNVITRNQLNRICFQYRTPLVCGSAIRFEGQLCVFQYQPEAPCYQCLSDLFGEQNLTCVEAGILSPIVGVIGCMQSLDAIKIMTKIHSATPVKLRLFDGITGSWREFNLPKNQKCSVCNPPGN